MEEKKLYVVIAYRFGNRDNHSYPIGVFERKQSAQQCADYYTLYRGGRYGCTVEECILNNFNEEDINYTREVFKTKSMMW